jgi:catalase
LSPALSLDNQPRNSIATRKIAMLVADGFDGVAAETVRAALAAQHAIVEVIGPVLGPVASDKGEAVEADKTYKTAASVFYDAIFIPGGEASMKTLEQSGDAIHFIQEAYKHCKAIAAIGEAVNLIALAEIDEARESGDAPGENAAAGVVSELGVVTAKAPAAAAALAAAFVQAIAFHRHWNRDVETIPA